MTRQLSSFFLTTCLFFSPILMRPVASGELMARNKPNKIIITVKDNVRPLGFRDAAGQLQGLEIDIARKLAEELWGSVDAVELRPVTNTDRIDSITQGEASLAIANLTATPARSRLINFSRYYYLNSTTFITLNPNIQTRNDLEGLTIAVLNQSSTIATVRHAIPNIQLMGVDSYPEALQRLETGEADVFAGDRTVLVGWKQEYPQYSLVPVNIGFFPLSIAIPKGRQHSDLYLQINQAINQWETSGWLQQRIEYWGLSYN